MLRTFILLSFFAFFLLFTNSRAEAQEKKFFEVNPDSLINFAKKFIGTPYVWAGNQPGGFDCSGFVKYVFSNFGIYLDRVASEQSVNGKWVARGNLRAGDIVFFDTDGGKNDINHTGIYIGNDNFVHASSGGGHVMISGLSESFYSRCYMTARRVISE